MAPSVRTRRRRRRRAPSRALPSRPASSRTPAYTRRPMLPFTGKEFLASLQDGREIWIYGQRVPDVTAHPAFRNPARMVARLYDALHDASTREALTCATDTGSGG